MDILKIDTEGLDPAVIKGARKALSTAKVSILYFEYHYLNLWGSTNLKGCCQGSERPKFCMLPRWAAHPHPPGCAVLGPLV